MEANEKKTKKKKKISKPTKNELYANLDENPQVLKSKSRFEIMINKIINLNKQ